MKNLSFLLCFLAGSALAQLKTIVQPKLAIQYELSDRWTVTEFSNNDWELPAGNNICPCSGSLNILKVPYGDEFEYIHMVIYPAEKKNSTLKKRRHIWQYEFKELEDPDTVKYGNNTFYRMVSKFLPTTNNIRFRDYTVWKLMYVNGNTYHFIYVWARPGLFTEYEAVFEKIFASMKVLPKS